MFLPSGNREGRQPSAFRNWESNIDHVVIEACDASEDASGFRAVFYLEDHDADEALKKFFIVGASFLPQRRRNLESAGYSAPMTEQAIRLVERRMGRQLAETTA
jgi:hypothetical protein